MPGYVHFTKDLVRNRNYINVVEWNPADKEYSTIHDEEFSSKLSDGWRSDQVFRRDMNGKRVFKLENVQALDEATPADLAAVNFDAMQAHLKAMNLQETLTEKNHVYADRLKKVLKANGNLAVTQQ